MNGRPCALLHQWLVSQVDHLGPESTAHCISEEEALLLFPKPPKGKTWASNMVLSTGTSSVNVLLHQVGSEWFCRHVGRDFIFTRRRPLRASLYFPPLFPPQPDEHVIAKVGFTSRPVEVRGKELQSATPVLFEHGKVMTVRSVHGFQLETFLHTLFAQRGQAVASKNKDGTTATENGGFDEGHTEEMSLNRWNLCLNFLLTWMTYKWQRKLPLWTTGQFAFQECTTTPCYARKRNTNDPTWTKPRNSMWRWWF